VGGRGWGKKKVMAITLKYGHNFFDYFRFDLGCILQGQVAILYKKAKNILIIVFSYVQYVKQFVFQFCNLVD
jgi:hypothetical protein